MIRTLLGHFRRAPTPRASHLAFTIYTKRGCGCCDRAMEVIRPRREAHGFAVEIVEIDGDPILIEKYGTTVPVVVVDGKVRFRGKVDPLLLDRLLEAEARLRPGPGA